MSYVKATEFWTLGQLWAKQEEMKAQNLVGTPQVGVNLTVVKNFGARAVPGKTYSYCDMELSDGTDMVKYSATNPKFFELQPGSKLIANNGTLLDDSYVKNGQTISNGIKVKFPKGSFGYMEIVTSNTPAPVNQTSPSFNQTPAFSSRPNLGQAPRGNQTDAQLVKSIYPKFYGAVERLITLCASLMENNTQNNADVDIVWEGME